MLRVFLAASEVKREPKREGSSGEAPEIGTIGDLVDLRVTLAIPSYVWSAVRLGGVGPPIRCLAQVVMLITAWRCDLFVHHRHWSDTQSGIGICLKRSQRGSELWLSPAQTATHA